MKATALNTLVRRIFDITASVIGLILLAPLFGLVALRIRREAGGPVFFQQVRIGKAGTPFRILKFRTMTAGSAGTKITATGDPRVTRAGKWLRKYKIDELPQLINVVRGEMSLIGPRPEVPDFVNAADPAWRAVLSVKPGITDLASLVHRDEEALLQGQADPESYYREVVLPFKLRLNAQHLQSRTLWRDLRLLFLTVQYSFFPSRFNSKQLEQSIHTRGWIA